MADILDNDLSLLEEFKLRLKLIRHDFINSDANSHNWLKIASNSIESILSSQQNDKNNKIYKKEKISSKQVKKYVKSPSSKNVSRRSRSRDPRSYSYRKNKNKETKSRPNKNSYSYYETSGPTRGLSRKFRSEPSWKKFRGQEGGNSLRFPVPTPPNKRSYSNFSNNQFVDDYQREGSQGRYSSNEHYPSSPRWQDQKEENDYGRRQNEFGRRREDGNNFGQRPRRDDLGFRPNQNHYKEEGRRIRAPRRRQYNSRFPSRGRGRNFRAEKEFKNTAPPFNSFNRGRRYGGRFNWTNSRQ